MRYLFSITCCLLILFATAHHVTSQNSAPEELSISFEQEFVLGGNMSQEAEYFLSNPYRVRTGRNGNIYVGDGGEANIKIFSPNGTFLRSVGRQGKGPGEFAGVPVFIVNSRNEIVALDAQNRRITRLSAKGEILFEHVPSEQQMVWGEKMLETAGGHYLILQKPRDIGEDDPDSHRNRVMHRYNASFEERLSSFGEYSELVPEGDSKFVKMVGSRINTGNFELVDDGKLWYAPGIYDGSIYEFVKENGRWTQAGTVKGSALAAEAIEVDNDGPGSMSITSFGAEGTQKSRGRINGYSLALLQMSDGRVLHFSGQRRQGQDSLRTRLEVFSPAGQLVGTSSFEEISIPANLLYFESHNPSLRIDTSDRLYFIDQEQAVVRIGRLQGL